MNYLAEKISEWLSEYLTQAKLESFVIGVSGGIDSAVTSTLAAMTGKPIFVLSMPIHQGEDQVDRASEHIEWLQSRFENITHLEYNLTEIFDDFKSLFEGEDGLALANSRARLRMTTLYQVASTNKGLVVGTGNKVEDFGVGFFTKYGDGGVDISPIADLYKSEVYEMAKSLEIIQSILDAPPTDGLWDDGRTDEDQMGITYDELEKAMKWVGREMTRDDAVLMEKYATLRKQNLHKMLPIPIFKR